MCDAPDDAGPDDRGDGYPSHVRCVSGGRNATLCGRWAPFQWRFVDVRHALRNLDQGGRLVPCPRCFAVALAEAIGPETPAGGEAPAPKPKEAPLTTQVTPTQVTIVNHGPGAARIEKQSRDPDGRYQAAYEELLPPLASKLVTLAEGESLQVLPPASNAGELA